METLKTYWSKLISLIQTYAKYVLIAILAVAGYFFVWPRLKKYFSKKKSVGRRRKPRLARSAPKPPSNVSAQDRGPGSEYMKRKMAYLRSLRRKK